MSERLPVFVYADDPVSQAGVEQLLRLRHEHYVVSSGQIDEARVAIVVTDTVDDAAVRTITGLQRDGCPRVMVVATHLDDAGVLAATEAGTLGLLRRSEATAEALAATAAHVAADKASLPSDLVGQLLSAVRRMQRSAGLSAHAITASVTEREAEVLRLLAEGRDTNEIAGILCYSERTVKGVIHEITSRLQLRNRSHAVAFALRHELI